MNASNVKDFMAGVQHEANQQKDVIKYYIVQHNPSLYAVMSEVDKPDWMGNPRTYKNYVAEARSEAQAKAIVSMLEGLA